MRSCGCAAAGPLRADRARDPTHHCSTGRTGAGARRRLERPRGRPLPANQAGGDRGSAADDQGASIHVLGWYSDGRVKYGIGVPKLLSLLADHKINARVQGLDAVPARDRPPVNVVRFAFQTMVGIGTLLALLAARLPRGPHPEASVATLDLVLPCPRARRSAVGGRTDQRLGDDRSRPPAMGRLPGDAHLAGGHRRPRHPRRLRHARPRLRPADRRRRLDPLASRPQAAELEPSLSAAEVD